MESEAAKKGSDILDASAEETQAASEADNGDQPSSTKPNEMPSTDENRLSETTSEDVVGEDDGNEHLTEEDGNDQSDKKQDREVAGNAEKASLDQTAASTGDETKEQLNESENDGATIAGKRKDREIDATGNQEKENQSPSPARKRKLETDSETKNEAVGDVSSTVNTSDKSNVATKPSAAFPKRPIKRARTAYFIFTDEKRPEVQAAHPGEGVAAVAKALGQLWGRLSAEEKKVYQDRASKERERVSQELEAYKAAGGKDLDSPSMKAKDPLATILPVARIRKICKLDPEVRGLSKEALLLVTKCSELMLQKLGRETVKVAQLQNRRKLLPDDVAHVCAHREQFLFLKDDVKDLVRSMELSSSHGKAGGSKKEDPSKQAAAAGTKKLTSYFSASK